MTTREKILRRGQAGTSASAGRRTAAVAPGPADLAVPVATQWHCAHTVASEAQVPGATEAVEKNTTTSVCLVLKVFITVHFGSTSITS